MTGQIAGGEPPGAYYAAFINNEWDGIDAHRDTLGFFIKPLGTPTGRIFPLGVGARMIFGAPGSTRIRSVTFNDVIRVNDRDRQTLRFALYGPNGFKENDDIFEAEELSTESRTLPSVPFAEDQDTPANSVVMWMFTSPCVEGADLNCPPVINSNTSGTLMKVGSVEFVLTDFDFPTVQATGTLLDLQDRWSNATDVRTINPSASDEGSGVRDLTVSVQDAAGSHTVRSIQSPCHPDHDQPGQDNAICPQHLTFDEPVSLDASGLQEGRSTFTLDASDLGENTASAAGTAATFSVYLDRKPPSSTVAGELYDDAGTWTRPRAPSQLTVTSTDSSGGEGRNSGIAHNLLRAVDASGATVLDRDADTCTPPGPIAAPCDPGKASAFTVDPRQLPEGPIAFTARSRDLAGNDSDPVTWTLRLDRTPPAARATGDLLALTSQHTNSTAPTGVTLQGRDAASGVARLQLIASNSDGETILADRDTCAGGDIDPADGACPHNPSVTVMVDPGDLPDGPTTFIARAVDHAGIRSVDNQDWDTYVDHTPPEPPDSVAISQTTNTSVRITWPTVVDQPLGSGGVSYEYLVTAGGHPIGGWRPSTSPYAQVGGLPPGVDISVLVRAVDAAHNVGKPAVGRHAWRAVSVQAASVTGANAEEIRKGLQLDKMEKAIVAEAERITLRAAEAAAFRTLLKGLVKVVSKATIIGIAIERAIDFFLGDGDPNCELGPLYSQSRPVFAAATDVLVRTARSSPGPHPVAQSKLGDVRYKLIDLRGYIRAHPYVKACSGGNKMALRTIDSLGPRLDAAQSRLEEQDIIDEYYDTNRETETNTFGYQKRDEARIGYRTCRRVRSPSDCRSIPTLLPGSDTPEARDHIRRAILPTDTRPQQDHLLHWVPEHQREREGWYRRIPIFALSRCIGTTGGTTGNDCDEYPFRATREGGPGADLEPVDSDDNQAAGRKAARFYTICRVGASGTRHDFLVAPLPSGVPITTRFACNGRR